uniref:Protein kinase domain-containing protein n=1 Tax=Eutreptiella gymnastica TaxID=73025 RepID=A0A7S1ILY5_9EUGL
MRTTNARPTSANSLRASKKMLPAGANVYGRPLSGSSANRITPPHTPTLPCLPKSPQPVKSPKSPTHPPPGWNPATSSTPSPTQAKKSPKLEPRRPPKAHACEESETITDPMHDREYEEDFEEDVEEVAIPAADNEELGKVEDEDEEDVEEDKEQDSEWIDDDDGFNLSCTVPKDLLPMAESSVKGPVQFHLRTAADAPLEPAALIKSPVATPKSNGYWDDIHLQNWILKFSDLELSEQLGAGGFGTVHKGRLKKSNDTIAVKICLCQDSDMVASFKREVKMLSSMRHEHIVLFRGACIDVPNLCIVTELMCRGNLYNLLHDDDMDMPWKLRMRWTRDIARGMNYLHTLEPAVVHRDLKSPNVLVNDYFMIKLCDFGMSRTKKHTRIHTKQMGGSPPWTAPECLRGDDFTEKSDIYSFGVLMWEIMTREIPWEDKEMVQLVGLVGFKNKTLDIPPLELHPGCPKKFVELMQECFAADPPERPAFRDMVPIFEDLAINTR